MYKKHVFCCVNERPKGHVRGCCKAKDAVKLHNYMKVRAKELKLADIRINKSGCLDFCEEGPVMVVYPDAIWYSYNSTEDIDEIIESHLVNNKPVKRLLMQINKQEKNSGKTNG